MPHTIRFAGLAPSPTLESFIEGRIAHIERLCPGITFWHVNVTQEARHQRHGNPWSVHVQATLPGLDLAATRTHDADVHVATGEALDAILRELQDAIHIRRGQVKQHADRAAAADDEAA